MSAFEGKVIPRQFLKSSANSAKIQLNGLADLKYAHWINTTTQNINKILK
jgi:hypothetical protein